MGKRGVALRGLLIAALLLAALGLALLDALRPPEPLEGSQRDAAIADVTVVNPGSGRRAHQTLRMAGSTIRSISSYSPATDGTAEALRHQGSYVLPGLIDLHVHHPPGQLATDVRAFHALYLAHGVTTVRDCGSIDGSILEIRAHVAAGRFAGPRIHACGPLIDGDPAYWPGAKVAHDAAEAERIVDDLAASRVDCIKAYSRLGPDALRGIRAAASRHRLTLVGHVPIGVPLEAAHLDDVQHLTGVPGVVDRSTDPDLIAALLSGWETVEDARIDSVVRISLEQRIAYTPTIVVIQRLIRLAHEDASLADPGARLLPRYYRERLWKPGAMASWRVPPLTPAAGDRILRNFRTVVRRLHEAGVTLHVGTDTFNPFVVPGVSMHEELRNFVEAGFTPEQALEAATRRNGESLAEPGLGVIEAGAPADLLIFGADPTRDLEHLATLEAVVANGRYYPRQRLDQAVARYRDYFAGWLYDRLMMLLFPSQPQPPQSDGADDE